MKVTGTLASEDVTVQVNLDVQLTDDERLLLLAAGAIDQSNWTTDTVGRAQKIQILLDKLKWGA